MESQKITSTFKYAFGPGLILAAAAIGVSHLVQSTRAGADYGFTLVWAVVLASLMKYPFLEYGPRYAAATGESLIAGYKKLGNWALWIYIIFTVGTMFAIQAAVTIVTASLAVELTGIELPLLVWSIIILMLCIGVLYRGGYNALDSLIKVVMVVLSLSTIAAFLMAFFDGSTPELPAAPSVWDVAGITFLIALMGWMPIPIDAAAWNSLWTLEREKQTQHKASLKDSLLDFNIGYVGATILALLFLGLGALVMFGSGVSFSSSGAAFAQQLIDLYTQTLGEWAHWIIIICAFTTMFSTTLTVTDSYPRVSQEIITVLRNSNASTSGVLSYRGLMIIISIISMLVLYLTGSQFTYIIDLATSLSFLTAPALAFINYRLIMSKYFPDEHKPAVWLQVLSWLGLMFLTAFALVFFYWRFFV
ncbi:Nramp family divalent metal transporter [Gracilimonas mengyeensis]|uniref:Mn2+ and Fe2+ transporters of the NRAMP family n=1 Tax=Gracilimonas mengyeensis TaxID=1302730 RepID=A0A521CNY5_9BACT|nr:Nramp family divalent metal transporter [Gracilimonas mengyeensis]SMO61108.1 Mn2+ and Fe2+ transporters of the NRAMP family [Gracilimonas mengyeensis]